jgi:hypothetical protein
VDDTLTDKISSQELEDFHLLLWGEAVHRHLQDAFNAGNGVHSDERLVVKVGKESHDELAVHPVGHTAMTRHKVAKVLDLKRPLQSTGKEPTEWCDQRGKSGHGKNVELYGLDVDGGPVEWDVVGVLHEHRVRSALEAGPGICTEILFESVSGDPWNICGKISGIKNVKSESGMLLGSALNNCNGD